MLPKHWLFSFLSIGNFQSFLYLKKRLLLFSFCSLLSAFTFAQKEFAPAGATWHYEFLEYSWTRIDLIGYEEVKYDRDTLIDGKDCKILTRKRVGERNHQIVEYYTPEKIIWQDSFTVYSWCQGTFYKIYDFGLEVGDTVTFSDVLPEDFQATVSENTYQIDSVYYDTINGESIKNLRMVILEGFSTSGTEIINEKFGGLPTYVFYMEGDWWFDIYRASGFRCYQDDNFPLYQTNDTIPCEYYENVTGILDIADTGFQIYPNPLNDFLQISNEGTSTYDLAIFNLSGQLIYQAANETSGSKKVDCSRWAPGTYFVEIKTGQRRSYAKLLKVD